MFGKRRFVNSKDHNPFEDERNNLIFTYLRYVEHFQPKWFLMENVPGIVNLEGGYFLEELLKMVEKLGYKNYDYKIINTADYGVPQKRKRFILLANSTGNLIPWPKPKYYESPEDWQKPWRAVGEVITGLANPKTHERYHNHKPMSHSPEVVKGFLHKRRI